MYKTHGNNNRYDDTKNHTVQGRNNYIDPQADNVIIQGDNNRVIGPVKNVCLLATSDVIVNANDVLYRNGILQTMINDDYRILGYHKDRTFDGNGDLITVKYWRDYDPDTQVYSDLAVQENRIYTRDTSTGLLIDRNFSAIWYDEEGEISGAKSNVMKYYTAKEGFENNKRSRQNLIDTASLYFFDKLIENDPDTAFDNKNDFESLTELAQAQYVKGTLDPLLTIIVNSTDNTKPEYRAYMTVEMQTTLLLILDVDYTV